MSEKQFLLVLLGAIDTAVFGWIVVSSIRRGDTYGGLLFGWLDRERNPILFWLHIAICVAFWLLILSAIVEALLQT